MTNIEIWILLQVAVEAVLILFMIVFMFRLKRVSRQNAAVPSKLQESLDHFLTESEKLSQTFNETLQQKKELTLNLLLKLERKTAEMRQLLDQAEQNLTKVRMTPEPVIETDKANPAAAENRALVIQLADRGLSVEEIARKAKLHRGEVELILDLEKQFRV